jgi:hypothetical protein
MTYWVILGNKNEIYMGADTARSNPRIKNSNTKSAYNNNEVTWYQNNAVKLLSASYITKKGEKIAVGICICGRLWIDLEKIAETRSLEEVIQRVLTTISTKDKTSFATAENFLDEIIIRIKSSYLQLGKIRDDQDLFHEIAIGLGFSNESEFSIAHYNGFKPLSSEALRELSAELFERTTDHTKTGYLEMHVFPDMLKRYLNKSILLLKDDQGRLFSECWYRAMITCENSTDPLHQNYLYSAVYPQLARSALPWLLENPKNNLSKIINTAKSEMYGVAVSDCSDFLHLKNGKEISFIAAPRTSDQRRPINYAQDVSFIPKLDVLRDTIRAPYDTQIQKNFENLRQFHVVSQEPLPYQADDRFMQFGSYINPVTEPQQFISKVINGKQPHHTNPHNFFHTISAQPVVKYYDKSVSSEYVLNGTDLTDYVFK